MVTTLIGALVIGMTLGMLGSGGSAITVPVLIYVVGHGAKESIAESMAIVGLISIVAAVPYARAHQIDWRSVWYFGIPGMLGTFVGAWLGGIASDALQLVVFGGVLLAAAWSMLKGHKGTESASASESAHRSPLWKIAIEGCIVGIVTGFVGVGGGFLIVPALVVLGKLPMRLAIGTSLVIIVMKAAVGFARYEHYLLSHDLSVDGRTVLVFASVGMIGSLVGRSINQRLDQVALKRAFGGFLVVLGGFLIFSEGTKLMNRPSDSSTAVSNPVSRAARPPVLSPVKNNAGSASSTALNSIVCVTPRVSNSKEQSNVTQILL